MSRNPRLTEETIAFLLANREEGRWLAWKERAERKLIDFIHLMWPVLEPGKPFFRVRATEAICEHLEAVSRGEIRKLLINVPPGCMKSLSTCVFWPSWEWGPLNRPQLRYVCASYSSALTERDNDRCRILMQSPEYRRLWGDRVVFAKDATIKFTNSKRGFKLATSVGGIGTGERGDRIIIDDPHNVKEAESDAVRNEALRWFAETMPTRHNNKKKAVTIVIMQRVHEQDVSGQILAQELGYEHLCLPMEYQHDHPYAGKNAKSSIHFVDWRKTEGELLIPELYDEPALEELKKELRSWGGTYAEAGQLEQFPVSRKGGLFNMERLGLLEHARLGGKVVRHWDLAGSKRSTSPYTAGVKMRRIGDIFIIEDVVRERVTPTELDELIKRVAKEDGHNVVQSFPQDPGQAGLAQVAHIAALLNGYDVRFSLEGDNGNKEVRARPFAAQVGAGNVFLVRNDQWNAPYRGEMKMFPASKYKDQIDATSGAYYQLIAYTDDEVGDGGEVFVGDLPTRTDSPLAILHQRAEQSVQVITDEYGGVF